MWPANGELFLPLRMSSAGFGAPPEIWGTTSFGAPPEIWGTKSGAAGDSAVDPREPGSDNPPPALAPAGSVHRKSQTATHLTGERRDDPAQGSGMNRTNASAFSRLESPGETPKSAAAEQSAGKASAAAAFNLYHANFWVIEPATAGHGRGGCSYVELVLSSRNSVCVPCLAGAGVQVRGVPETCQLSDQTAYWVCAYANNQHQLQNEICNNPRKTSFYRAIQLCAGVLLVLDQNATPFTRTFVWKWGWQGVSQGLARGKETRLLRFLMMQENP
eukprot:s1396_g7.t1